MQITIQTPIFFHGFRKVIKKHNHNPIPSNLQLFTVPHNGPCQPNFCFSLIEFAFSSLQPSWSLAMKLSALMFTSGLGQNTDPPTPIPAPTTTPSQIPYAQRNMKLYQLIHQKKKKKGQHQCQNSMNKKVFLFVAMKFSGDKDIIDCKS